MNRQNASLGALIVDKTEGESHKNGQHYIPNNRDIGYKKVVFG